MVAAGFANALLLAVLWVLYMSIVHVGQDWYGYGWEIQLLETGFLAIFLCPLLDPRPFPRREPPMAVIWLFRWLVFRIMLGAGLIKLRGDPAWRDLTALYYHFETQPIPNPLSRWFHFLPRVVLRIGAGFNHVAELVAPWFVFGPRIARQLAGARDHPLPAHDHLERQSVVPQLADDRARARLLRRFGLVEIASRGSGTARACRRGRCAAESPRCATCRGRSPR